MKPFKDTTFSGRLRQFLNRKWLSRSLFVLACLATLIAVFYVVENWRGRRAWNQFAQAWEAKGEHFDAAAFIPPEVPPGENFATAPFLAPLFDFVPGTQQWRDTNAVERIKAFPPHYEAASGRLPREDRPATNTWVRPRPDLRAWYAAFYATNTHGPGSPGLPEMAIPGSPARVQTASPENALTNVSLTEAASGLLAALAETEPVLAELREAAQRPYSRFGLRYEEGNLMAMLLPHLAPLRRMTAVLQLRASANLALGREQAAFEDTLLMFRLAQALQSEPLLISYLVRVAQLQLTLSVIAEGLEQHQWTDAHLRRFQEELGRLDLLADGKRALRAERAFSGSFIQTLALSPEHLQAVGVYDGNPVPLTWQRLLAEAIPDGWFYFERLNFSRLFQEYALPAIEVEAHRVDPIVAQAFGEKLQNVCRRPPLVSFFRHETLSRILLPALDKVTQRVALAQAGVDAGRVACALERYRLAHGNYPASLAALQPEFMSSLPPDVISGEPLKYRVTGEGGFVLYSVGWNREDDGGRIVYRKNGRSVESMEGDWVWR